MTIQDLVDIVKDISLNKINAKSFYIGNNWDMSATKGDQYPCVWFEMPVLVTYTTVGSLSKEFTFSLDFLGFPKPDNTTDEIQVISDMEELADLFLYYLKQNKTIPMTDLPSGLSVKSINADVACGIRLDIKINTGRKCPA